MKTLYATKERLVEAFNAIDFETYEKYVPKSRGLGQKEWTKKYLERLKDKELKEMEWDIAYVTGFSLSVMMHYQCLFNGWLTPVDQITKHIFMHKFIIESYEKIKKHMANRLLPESGTFLTYYKTLYSYFLARKMLECVDNVYFKMDTVGFPVCTPLIIGRDCLILRYNNLSIRGRRRVKLWDTFIRIESVYTKRVKVGVFFNLKPKSLKMLDALDNDDDSVKFINREKSINGEQLEIVHAVHPHISNGTPCYGAWENKLHSASGVGWAELFFKAIRGFLNTWTVESPYWNINTAYYNTHTYENKDTKKKALVHWSPVDTMYMVENHSAIWNDSLGIRNTLTKILCNEKLIKGYYTNDTLGDMFSLIRDGQVILSLDLLSRVHEIPNPINNPYYKLELYKGMNWNFQMEKHKSKTGKVYLVPLIGKKYQVTDRKFQETDSLSFIEITSAVLSRAKRILNKMWNKYVTELTYDSLMVHTISGFEDKYFNIDTFTEMYKAMYLSQYPKRKVVDEIISLEESKDRAVLRMIESPDYANKQILDWKLRSLEEAIRKSTKIKEEYVNAFTYLSGNKGQGQLFPQ